ncbi:MAG: Xaa-Pro peptidase family protein [Thermoplasmata archaeon]|nr:Xaa-Pro peptidase family protein [Thermoplasmata archaeon]
MATKEKKILAAAKKKVDAVVLVNGTEPNLDLSFFYATGIVNGLFEDCVAIVKPKGVEVLSSSLEELSARQAGVKTSVFRSGKEREELTTKRLKGLARIGVNSSELTHQNYKFIKKCAKGATLIDVSKAVQEARMIKDAEEIERIKKACDIVSKTSDEIPNLVKKGQMETEAAAELNYRMMMLGASGPAFGTNASFGPTTAEPHYVPASRRLKAGQLALFDFGATYRRYVSDLTRTFACSRPSAKQREMYDIVLSAQLAAIDEIHDGAQGSDVDRAARSIIDGSRFKGRFIHGTGHGLGVSVHDPGYISSMRNMTLREGMVLTVEPGVYLKGFGGVRIEDDVLVTKKGCRILTSASKEFLSI